MAVARPQPMKACFHAHVGVLHQDVLHQECLQPLVPLDISQEVDPFLIHDETGADSKNCRTEPQSDPLCLLQQPGWHVWTSQLLRPLLRGPDRLPREQLPASVDADQGVHAEAVLEENVPDARPDQERSDHEAAGTARTEAHEYHDQAARSTTIRPAIGLLTLISAC